MNRQIARLATGSLALLIALIVGTTYWQTWATGGLAARQDNEIQQVAQFSIRRGVIYSADGVPLAVNVKHHYSGQTLYFRRYPTGNLFSDIVGYSTQTHNQTGLEQNENDFLTSSNANLDSVISSTLDRLKGTTVKGNDLILTVRSGPQRLAEHQLGSKCGAVVALEPATGKVLVIATNPSYDSNLVERSFSAIGRGSAGCSPPAPLLDRATAGLFTPGSSFKLVTAAAALQSGAYTPDSPFQDPGYCTEYGKKVYNAGAPDQAGPETFGSVTLFQGLVHSINSVFCNIGQRIGAKTILEYARRFGFYSRPAIELPEGEKLASGLYQQGSLFWPKDPARQVDAGRLAFGQWTMQVTPLQMAMVAATIANHGTEMRPYLVDRIVGPDRKTIVRTTPQVEAKPISPTVASELSAMMVGAVQSGTGTAAQIPGIQVAGKTGTAETGVAHTNTTWFVCFAPADRPRVVVAVVLQNQHGFGGTTAAPIAKVMLQALLHSGSNP